MKNTFKVITGIALVVFGVLSGIFIKNSTAQHPQGHTTFKYQCTHIQLGWDVNPPYEFLSGANAMNNMSAQGWKLHSIIEAPNSGAPAKQKDYMLVWEQPIK